MLRALKWQFSVETSEHYSRGGERLFFLFASGVKHDLRRVTISVLTESASKARGFAKCDQSFRQSAAECWQTYGGTAEGKIPRRRGEGETC